MAIIASVHAIAAAGIATTASESVAPVVAGTVEAAGRTRA
jgi:hypothetical protein